MFAPKFRNQFYGTLCANLICVAYGTVCGWPSASFPDLLSPDASPLPSGSLNIEQLSWVGSQMCIGSIFGNSYYSWAMDRFGRKNALIQSALPCLIGWCMLMFAQNAYYLYVARFVLGFAGAGSFVVIPMFVSEIADSEVRGSLGSLMVFSCNVGILISFIVGHYVQYTMRAVVLLAFPIVFLLLFVSFPETPVFLMRQGREEEAERSLRFYRREPKAETEPELGEDNAAGPMLKQALEELRRTQSPAVEEDLASGEKGAVKVVEMSTWQEFNTRHGRRAAIIGIGLISFAQFCGCFAMLNYTGQIFEQSGSTMTPNVAAIMMGVVQLLGAYVSTVLVDRTGRKFLLIASGVGTAVGHIMMATFMRLQLYGWDVSAYSWVPMLGFGMLVFLANWGLMTLPFLVVSEVMPERVRSTGMSLCMTLLYVIGFVMLKGFPLMVELLGMSGSLFVFAGCSLASAAFVVVLVPETRGKSFEMIQKIMEK